METAQEIDLPLLFAGNDGNAFDIAVKMKNTKLIEWFL